MTSLAERLAARTLELVDIPSESGHEAAIRDHLLALVPTTFSAELEGDEAYLFAGERRSDVPLVVLAGHYDTVPAQENLPGRIEDGAVHGLGASDMKGGVAVALELVRDLAARPPGPVDVALLLFGREELPYEHDPLPALLEGSELVREASLAILLEPTDGLVHAGCLGNVIARLSFHGRSGHSARPWDADNAIAHAVQGLQSILELEHRQALVAGLPFVEVLSVTRVHAGIADNVIPDLATATLNLRYPPDRTPTEAEEHLRSLCPPGATLEIVSHAPAGRVVRDNPLVAALLAAGAGRVEPKQAWTNVADFTAHGIDAVNFGPGHTRFAHRRDEQVEIAALVHAYETIERLLTGAIGEDGG
ncbi:MAG TPA: succinyl-diaminopimelate desuccinylase [Gaiellaceae bacterium]|nr:succinyl-diaminopimelate desuccinylase [Gaiellaceae bacterium]HLF68323.1 succinyl-diaminopimelate desuccinylase [Gaiellaceae bacterium]